MKYWQPYGVSDPDAPYVNGNPSTGTMGSIPPAGAIEHPQREIVNVIGAAGLAPDSTDLWQMARGIQGGALTFGFDLGSLSDFHLRMSPTMLAYVDGMIIRFRANRDAPGACTLRCDALPQMPLVKRGGSPIQAYDWTNGDMIDCIYDGLGGRFMVLGLSPVSALRAAMDYYVNFGSGADTNDGLSTQTPFKTIRKGIAMALSFNQNGFDVNIRCADGISADSATYCPPLNGSGFINIYGNVSNPDACRINSSAGSCFVVGGPNYRISGFALAASHVVSGDATCCVWAASGSVYCYALNFTGAYNGMMTASGGRLIAVGPFHVSGVAAHFMGTDSGMCGSQEPGYPTVTFDSATQFTQGFAVAGRGGVTTALFTALPGFANVVGPKFLASGNGVIYSGGASLSALPGNSAGVLLSGGQYV